MVCQCYKLKGDEGIYVRKTATKQQKSPEAIWLATNSLHQQTRVYKKCQYLETLIFISIGKSFWTASKIKYKFTRYIFIFWSLVGNNFDLF